MDNQRIIDEKNKYEKIYTDLVFAVSDLRDILDEEELQKRSFIKKVDVLRGYIEFLDKKEKELNTETNKGFLNKLFKKEVDVNSEINSYLTSDVLYNIEKLDKCRKCKCINCVSSCSMNHCRNCRDKEYVCECDKQNSLLTKSDDTVTLYNGDDEYLFDVAAWLVEKENNNIYRYVYLIDKRDPDNQHILRYSKFKGEENYDSVITDDTTDELQRINNKFIEMGLDV